MCGGGFFELVDVCVCFQKLEHKAQVSFCFLSFKAAYSAVKTWGCCLISCLELYALHNHYLTL